MLDQQMVFQKTIQNETIAQTHPVEEALSPYNVESYLGYAYIAVRDLALKAPETGRDFVFKQDSIIVPLQETKKYMMS